MMAAMNTTAAGQQGLWQGLPGVSTDPALAAGPHGLWLVGKGP
jgi:hypothetical protein